MKIAVFGTGGVGGYFGGRLAQGGEEVSFIARGAQLEAIRASGLRISSPKGDFVIQPAQATSDAGEVGKVDVVLLGVKAWQVVESAQAMLPMIGAETAVLPLQNGVSAPEQVAQILGEDHVLGGLCQISAFIAEPGHIQHAGIEPYVAFGEPDNRPSRRVARLQQAFERSGVKVEVPADIQAAMWEKYLFIAPLSGVGAATRAPVGVMRSLPPVHRLMQQFMEEIVAVAQARGVKLDDEAITRKMAFIDAMEASVTASMQRDMLAGKPSELEALVGEVVRMGQERIIATPASGFVYSILLPQELQARGQLEF
jgi:2-dehydropantoate 2-reductase